MRGPQRDSRARHAAVVGLRVHVRLRDSALYEGQSGRIVKSLATIEANVAEATAKADGIFRVWSTIMSDPAAFPMFKGGYPLTAAGRAGLAQWNSRDNSLLHCGTEGHAVDQ